MPDCLWGITLDLLLWTSDSLSEVIYDLLLGVSSDLLLFVFCSIGLLGVTLGDINIQLGLACSLDLPMEADPFLITRFPGIIILDMQLPPL